ncbi:MAG: endolytic transglycosylase MltG [Bacteroidales bacterium]|nr:endolytic transglycosylase MltG [Bacteroidales bacterium]
MAYYHPKYSKNIKKKRTVLHKFIIYILGLLIIAALIIGYLLYNVIYKSNVWLNEKEQLAIYIPTNSNFNNVKSILYEHGVIINRKNFEWLAKQKTYPGNIKAGKFLIKEGMSNDKLINLLRSGINEPVQLIFNNIRTKKQLAEKISEQIEADDESILSLLNDTSYIKKFGLTSHTITTIFIPNTYEFFWNTNAKQFIERIYSESKKFWTDERINKANELNMTTIEVITLASIIEQETSKNDEKPVIAGVYINRLNKNWRLQADPTLIFALGDYGIKRVLNEHKEIDSPYNTYKIRGLPPGPICIPSIASIDAVLNYEKNNYLYFCAKDDLSGYHSFAKTNAQHVRNARAYQKALNKMRIWK